MRVLFMPEIEPALPFLQVLAHDMCLFWWGCNSSTARVRAYLSLSNLRNIFWNSLVRASGKIYLTTQLLFVY